LCVLDVIVAAIIPREKPFLVWPETLNQREGIVFVKTLGRSRRSLNSADD